jgi:hypothetical protein
MGLKTLQGSHRLPVVLAADVLARNEPQVIEARLGSCQLVAPGEVGNLQIERPENYGITVVWLVQQYQSARSGNNGDLVLQDSQLRSDAFERLPRYLEPVRQIVKRLILIVDQANAQGRQHGTAIAHGELMAGAR